MEIKPKRLNRSQQDVGSYGRLAVLELADHPTVHADTEREILLGDFQLSTPFNDDTCKFRHGGQMLPIDHFCDYGRHGQIMLPIGNIITRRLRIKPFCYRSVTLAAQAEGGEREAQGALDDDGVAARGEAPAQLAQAGELRAQGARFAQACA